MKKNTVVAFIAGIMLAVSTSVVYAEVSSLIGKRVDGQIPLIINGVASANPAVTIEGVSYIPLRAAGQLFGYDVAWIDGEVVMEQSQVNKADQPTAEELAEIARVEQERLNQEAMEQNAQAKTSNSEVLRLTLNIEGKQRDVGLIKSRISEIEKKIEENPPYTSINGPTTYKESPHYERDLAILEKLRSDLATLEAELAALETEKSALESMSNK